MRRSSRRSFRGGCRSPIRLAISAVVLGCGAPDDGAYTLAWTGRWRFERLRGWYRGGDLNEDEALSFRDVARIFPRVVGRRGTTIAPKANRAGGLQSPEGFGGLVGAAGLVGIRAQGQLRWASERVTGTSTHRKWRHERRGIATKAMPLFYIPCRRRGCRILSNDCSGEVRWCAQRERVRVRLAFAGTHVPSTRYEHTGRERGSRT